MLCLPSAFLGLLVENVLVSSAHCLIGNLKAKGPAWGGWRDPRAEDGDPKGKAGPMWGEWGTPCGGGDPKGKRQKPTREGRGTRRDGDPMGEDIDSRGRQGPYVGRAGTALERG